MVEAILEILGELLLSSRKVRPWVKTAFVSTILTALTLVLCWGIYMNCVNGDNETGTVLLTAAVAAGLLSGYFYVWKRHRNNWEKH